MAGNYHLEGEVGKETPWGEGNLSGTIFVGDIAQVQDGEPWSGSFGGQQ